MKQNNQITEFVENLKDRLNMTPKSCVGVDFGFSTLRICELVHHSNGKFKISKFIAGDMPEASLLDDEVIKEDEVKELFLNLYQKSKIKNPNICLGLWGPNCMAKRIQLPGGSEEEIADQVEWEAEQYVPFDIDESALNHFVLGENEGGGVDVIVAAALNDLVERFSEIVYSQKTKVKVVDISVLAYTNAFEFVYKDELEPDNSYILFDFGAQKSQVVVYRRGSISFSKELAIGGLMITEEIQRQLGISYLEAESLKITPDENGNYPEEIVEIINDVLKIFWNELKKTFDFYITSTGDDSIVKCFVSGGSISLPGFMEGLSTLLGVEVEQFDLFSSSKVDIDKKIDIKTVEFIRNRGVTAFGLAMRSRD